MIDRSRRGADPAHADRAHRAGLHSADPGSADPGSADPGSADPTTGGQPRHATVADHVVDRLASWGVVHYYGYPGDGINGMTSALQRRDGTTFVQVRHEETAGFAAGAYVKYGGAALGAALVTSGPGAVHALNGLYDAKLDDRLPGNAMISVDCGTVTAWYARHLHVRPGMLASLSGTLLSMGGGMPYGIAAKFAHPDRPLFALLGDGAMQMNGVNELITVAKYWRGWLDPRFALLVLNNRDLAFVSWEQRSGEGTPKFDASQLVPDVDYAAWARTLGLRGIRVDDPAQVGPAWDAALAADRPVVIDAVVDPAELMIPPHFTAEQAAHRGGGDPRRLRLARHSAPRAAAAAATLLPHRS